MHRDPEEANVTVYESVGERPVAADIGKVLLDEAVKTERIANAETHHAKLVRLQVDDHIAKLMLGRAVVRDGVQRVPRASIRAVLRAPVLKSINGRAHHVYRGDLAQR